MAGLFDSFDPDELDDLSGRFLAAIVAVVKFGRPSHVDSPDLYEAALTKALIVSHAAIIAHPQTDAEQRDELTEAVIAELRKAVADQREQG
jgi:hypothetical protein